MHLTLDAHRLEYRIVLPARPSSPEHTMLVLLHEGLGSVATWKDFPDVLATSTGYPVLAYSRYGYGNSSKLEESRTPCYMHHEALTVLPEVLTKLGIHKPPFLIGHSDGASIAIIYAGGGQAVKGMVLMAPHVFVEDLTTDAIATSVSRFKQGGLAAKLARYHRHPHSMFNGWRDIWLKTEFRAWNIESSVQGCTAPMLLIQGGNDPYGTLAQIESIERRTKGPVEKLIFSDCGHAPHAERPDETVASISAFVRKWVDSDV
ncbi:MAG: alpha/beta fold hydrolase [Burkholderiales bacterium]|nr:alpha/beta fold hydrolase [Burkholderiales bacterium]